MEVAFLDVIDGKLGDDAFDESGSKIAELLALRRRKSGKRVGERVEGGGRLADAVDRVLDLADERGGGGGNSGSIVGVGGLKERCDAIGQRERRVERGPDRGEEGRGGSKLRWDAQAKIGERRLDGVRREAILDRPEELGKLRAACSKVPRAVMRGRSVRRADAREGARSPRRWSRCSPLASGCRSRRAGQEAGDVLPLRFGPHRRLGVLVDRSFEKAAQHPRAFAAVPHRRDPLVLVDEASAPH